MKNRLVISAVNLTEGGPLTILDDCLDSVSRLLSEEWEIIALVHDVNLVKIPGVTYIAVPWAKKSWLFRIYCEWFYFYGLSKKIKPDLWFSLHDITPRVVCRKQVVYCHNPSPFYKLSLREALLDKKFCLFNLFYRYLYAVFIRKNHQVIVQQDWLRDAFNKLYGSLPIIVAHPSVSISHEKNDQISQNSVDIKTIFLYPAFPRVFKNFELIAEAVKLLNQNSITGFEVRFTIAGDENKYSKWLNDQYRSVKNLVFIGRQNKRQMQSQYQQATAVLFASKLETWGLPITEAKAYAKPLIVVDLPYAIETIGSYDNLNFFKFDDPAMLASSMQSLIEGRWQATTIQNPDPKAPFVRGWDSLWQLLIGDL